MVRPTTTYDFVEVEFYGGQWSQKEMMILFVPYETPHCKGNESQDTVAFLETMLMSTERETRLQEVKGFLKSTR